MGAINATSLKFFRAFLCYFVVKKKSIVYICRMLL